MSFGGRPKRRIFYNRRVIYTRLQTGFKWQFRTQCKEVLTYTSMMKKAEIFLLSLQDQESRTGCMDLQVAL